MSQTECYSNTLRRAPKRLQIWKTEPKGIDIRTLNAKQNRQQSQVEEIANTISHGVGLIAAFIGTPILIADAIRNGNGRFIVGTAVFCATLIILYFASTVYHGLPPGKAKRVFRIIEHSAIFLLIAGTYTPFTLGVLHGAWGWSLLGVVWGLALLGVSLKGFYLASRPILFTSLYLMMGWVAVIAIHPFLARVQTAGLLLLLAGGLFYTVGVAFFATDSRLKYGHLIWHLFVMAGTFCHYFAILWYAA
ncbi:hemolysin III family protein [Desulfopila sp. IMCC35006]|nr:hemolysin III family protein [Desulfopila sp. IMCC35006]